MPFDLLKSYLCGHGKLVYDSFCFWPDFTDNGAFYVSQGQKKDPAADRANLSGR